MKTRRETTSGSSSTNQQVLVPVTSASAGEDPAGSLPAQQQKVIAQLKTAMLSLNKKHGTGTTNEVLGQIIQSLALDEEQKFAHNFKPDYSDVVLDSELSVPPLPVEKKVLKTETQHTLGPVPAWFSFDEVSEMEAAHFGPLFSMDEERWKMYLSLRNDVVRIYEDLIAPLNNKGELFLSSADLRTRLHPKDDAAYVFEIWKFLTRVNVINRGRKSSSDFDQKKKDISTTAVPPQIPKKNSSSITCFTKICCASCSRECHFFCYKPLLPPATSQTDPDETEEQGVKDEPMPQPLAEEEGNKYMCHDCTPAYFEKIPLRLFIDRATRERIVRGEFEEVSKEDVKFFLVLEDEPETVSVTHKFVDSLDFSKKILKNKTAIVKNWESYSDHSKSSSAASTTNPLEILDPQMQEALSGAGQKIRGSVLIEQQVRNMIYHTNLNKNEEIESTCPTTIDRAWELVHQVFVHVLRNLDSPLPAAESPLFVHAKKTDPVHLELLTLVYRIAASAILVKEEILGNFQSDKLISLAEERVDVKRQFLTFIRGLSPPSLAAAHAQSTSEIFVPVQIDSPSVKLASLSPKQLRLVNL